MRVGRRIARALAAPKLFERPEDELKFIEIHEACPYCGSKEMYPGPTAGIMVNYVCAGCDSRFNIGSIYGGSSASTSGRGPEIGQMTREREGIGRLVALLVWIVGNALGAAWNVAQYVAHGQPISLVAVVFCGLMFFVSTARLIAGMRRGGS